MFNPAAENDPAILASNPLRSHVQNQHSVWPRSGCGFHWMATYKRRFGRFVLISIGKELPHQAHMLGDGWRIERLEVPVGHVLKVRFDLVRIACVQGRRDGFALLFPLTAVPQIRASPSARNHASRGRVARRATPSSRSTRRR